MDSLREQAIAADESGDSPLAFELWGKLAENDTDGLPSLKYGALAVELKRWEIAEDALMAALRLRPRASIVKVFLGRLWAERRDRERIQALQTAKRWYLGSVERKKSAPIISLLGAVHVRLKEIPEAKAAFEEAIGIDPNYHEAMYNLAVLEENTNPERCVALLQKAIGIDPEYSIAHQALGRTLQKLGDLTSAEQHFRNCLEIDPNDYWSLLYLANLLAVLGRNEEAEQTYRHAVDLEPDWEGGLRYFAKFLASIGKRAEAAELRSRAVRIAAKD